jgi:hypothetical protein
MIILFCPDRSNLSQKRHFSTDSLSWDVTQETILRLPNLQIHTATALQKARAFFKSYYIEKKLFLTSKRTRLLVARYFYRSGVITNDGNIGSRVARFFMVQQIKTEKNIPYYHKIYQMAIKYTQKKFSVPVLSQIGTFW